MRTILLTLTALVAFAQTGDKLAPYYPTPPVVVDRMLQLGGLKANEKTYDLGSGDGRVVIMAAQKFKANAVGIEIDEKLYQESTEKIRNLKLEQKAKIVLGDILKQDLSDADLVTVYLLPGSNEKIRPMLEKQLKKGARVVAHDFDFAGWRADKIELVEDDGEGRSHTMFLYIR